MRWFRGAAPVPSNNAFHALAKVGMQFDRWRMVGDTLATMDAVAVARAGISPSEGAAIKAMRIAEVEWSRFEDIYSRVIPMKRGE